MITDFAKMGYFLVNLPRHAKVLIAALVDINLCVLSTWFAFYVRLGEFVVLSHQAFIAVALSIVTLLLLFYILGLYREILRYSGFKVLLTVSKAIFFYSIIYTSVITAIGIDGVPRTVGLIQPVLLLLLVGASRILVSSWLVEEPFSERISPKTTLIYGAGTAGRQLANALENSFEIKVVGFLDDDTNLHGQSLNGLPVYNPNKLASLVSTLLISDVYLAMPELSRKRRNTILNDIKEVKVSVRTLPSLTDLAQGKVAVSDLRELDIDDLLGREPVRPNQLLLSKTITHKTVMVTGAGGSIGSELCKQIINLHPDKLLLLEHSEAALYEIHKELENAKTNTFLVPLLASVQDETRIKKIMQAWKPQTVYHSAAYKHVPLVEQNIIEGLKNNVFGTQIALTAAIEQQVENFVLISTDKAVRPTNIMGASKRLAEMLLQAQATSEIATTLSMVRFGNVLGSSGSVVPRFREQIKSGGPVTLTHSEITRFFMTVSEAAQLVIQAAAMAKGGDLFVLDMGTPVRIMELAQRMIKLSGLTVRDDRYPDGDVAIEVVGLRSGEKLYEELLIGEGVEITNHPKIMRAREDFTNWGTLQKELIGLEEAIRQSDLKTVRSTFERLVSGYSAKEPIVDWTYLEN